MICQNSFFFKFIATRYQSQFEVDLFFLHTFNFICCLFALNLAIESWPISVGLIFLKFYTRLLSITIQYTYIFRAGYRSKIVLLNFFIKIIYLTDQFCPNFPQTYFLADNACSSIFRAICLIRGKIQKQNYLLFFHF